MAEGGPDPMQSFYRNYRRPKPKPIAIFASKGEAAVYLTSTVVTTVVWVVFAMLEASDASFSDIQMVFLGGLAIIALSVWKLLGRNAAKGTSEREIYTEALRLVGLPPRLAVVGTVQVMVIVLVTIVAVGDEWLFDGEGPIRGGK
jgi:hypothetical protein